MKNGFSFRLLTAANAFRISATSAALSTYRFPSMPIQPTISRMGVSSGSVATVARILIGFSDQFDDGRPSLAQGYPRSLNAFAAQRTRATSLFTPQIAKELPQPQDDEALGFLMAK